jgi:GNAT superfamily N-acetyltransferase
MKQYQLGHTVIRAVTEADAATIAAIHAGSWRDAYAHILAFLSGCVEEDRLSVWSQRLRDHPSTQLVNIAFDSSGRAQAFVCSYCDFDSVWVSLVDNLHLLPQARGQGIGEQLFRAVVGQLSERGSSLGLHLWVFEANVTALRFYSRQPAGRAVAFAAISIAYRNEPN